MKGEYEYTRFLPSVIQANDMKYLAGIDVGTTGVKCIIIGQDGKLQSSCTESYPYYTPNPGWSEQDPSDWYKATKEAMKKAVEKSGADKKISSHWVFPDRCMD